MTPSLSVQNLSVSFGKRTILRQIDVSFQPGQVTTLLGPNGAGKSTLLKVLSGEHTSNSDVICFGKPAKNWEPRELALRLGILPQHSGLTFPFTAQEVVEMGGIPLDCSQNEVTRIASEKMRQLGIPDFSSRLYPSLSGGEKQRVHFARVLTQLSKYQDVILMLDEPTSALDPAHQHSCLSKAREMAMRGATVIVVLHDLNLAAQYSDRLLMLHNGTLIADGTPKEVLTPENIAEAYHYQVQILPHPGHDFPLVIAA